jgi:hypothetical protein
MHHLRDFRSPAIFEFFNTIRHEPPLPANGCTCAVFMRWLDQPQFQIGPIGVRVQRGPKLPPL